MVAYDCCICTFMCFPAVWNPWINNVFNLNLKKKVKFENREIYIYFPCEIKKKFYPAREGPKIIQKRNYFGLSIWLIMKHHSFFHISISADPIKKSIHKIIIELLINKTAGQVVAWRWNNSTTTCSSDILY